MLLLAIDTSTRVGAIALRDENGPVGSLTMSVDTTHSEGLMVAVDTLLARCRRQREELTAVACAIGPGSYTGLRVGLATAQGLAYARRLACVGLSSLDVLAWVLPYAAHPVCPLLPARKGWIYARLYRWNVDSFQPLSEPLHIQPAELVSSIREPTFLYGPGLEPYRPAFQGMLGDQWLRLPSIFDVPRADLLAELAYQRLQAGDAVAPEALLPYYLGPSQAEVNWKIKQSQATPG